MRNESINLDPLAKILCALIIAFMLWLVFGPGNHIESPKEIDRAVYENRSKIMNGVNY